MAKKPVSRPIMCTVWSPHWRSFCCKEKQVLHGEESDKQVQGSYITYMRSTGTTINTTVNTTVVIRIWCWKYFDAWSCKFTIKSQSQQGMGMHNICCKEWDIAIKWKATIKAKVTIKNCAETKKTEFLLEVKHVANYSGWNSGRICHQLWSDRLFQLQIRLWKLRELKELKELEMLLVLLRWKMACYILG